MYVVSAYCRGLQGGAPPYARVTLIYFGLHAHRTHTRARAHQIIYNNIVARCYITRTPHTSHEAATPVSAPRGFLSHAAPRGFLSHETHEKDTGKQAM